MADYSANLKLVASRVRDLEPAASVVLEVCFYYGNTFCTSCTSGLRNCVAGYFPGLVTHTVLNVFLCKFCSSLGENSTHITICCCTLCFSKLLSLCCACSHCVVSNQDTFHQSKVRVIVVHVDNNFIDKTMLALNDADFERLEKTITRSMTNSLKDIFVGNAKDSDNICCLCSETGNGSAHPRANTRILIGAALHGPDEALVTCAQGLGTRHVTTVFHIHTRVKSSDAISSRKSIGSLSSSTPSLSMVIVWNGKM